MYFLVIAIAALLAGTVCVLVLFARNPHAEWYRAAAFVLCILQAAILFLWMMAGRKLEDVFGR